MEFVLLVLVVLPITFSVYTYEIAKSKGRASAPWAVGGLFLGPIAMLAVGLMEPKSVSDRENRAVEELAEAKRREEWEASRGD